MAARAPGRAVVGAWLLAVAVGAGGGTVALLAAEAAPAADSESARRGEADLEAIRDEIARLRGRLNAVSQQRAGLAGEVERLDLELALLATQIAEAGAARTLASERAEQARLEIGRLELRLDEVRADLRRRLVGLYRLGSVGLLRMVLALRAEGDLLPAIRQLRFLARRDGRALDRYLDTQTRLAIERQEVERRRLEADAWLRREEQRREEMVAARRRQAELLARLEREQRQLTARTSELAEKERRLAELLDVLFGRVAETELAGRPIQDFRGVLEWPVAGRVTTPFGPRLDPRYGTKVPHNGIEVAVTAGATVRAIYPGNVLFAAPFTGYGEAVVVLHPGRVLTLYAGLSRVGVAKGDVVSFKGEVGEASSRLYFEIRVNNKPEDPARWLR
jgi:septal ring factor EnvC (AmiA/AmiB activator)